VGSSADTAGLAAVGLNLVAQELAAISDSSAVSCFFARPQASRSNPMGGMIRLEMQEDMVVHAADQEIRISRVAMSEIRSWIARNRRARGGHVETGGLLWGEWDDATGIVWVSHASGPPPDSSHSETLFVCGVHGTREEHEKRLKQSRFSIGYVGMWHTHPISRPMPSDIDMSGMHQILTQGSLPPRKNVLLIAGRDMGHDALGVFLFRRMAGDADLAVHELKQGRIRLTEPIL
ncbi:MAG: Mov34/MPN/PAD-1 family protein, partial [Acidobacteria bacterium]|nr:Mov34/MPN/PAD-1 family protein [Acidobacteriota bacterium]